MPLTIVDSRINETYSIFILFILLFVHSIWFMTLRPPRAHAFFGSTTIGARGQMVVPVAARKALMLNEGEPLLVFAIDDEALIVAKVSKIEKIASHLAQQVDQLRRAAKKLDLIDTKRQAK